MKSKNKQIDSEKEIRLVVIRGGGGWGNQTKVVKRYTLPVTKKKNKKQKAHPGWELGHHMAMKHLS